MVQQLSADKGRVSHSLSWRSLALAIVLTSGIAPMVQAQSSTQKTAVNRPATINQPATDSEDEGADREVATNDPRFACELLNGRYAVMYYPESFPDEAFPWATPQQLGGGWTAERRCQEISRRLEEYRPDGLLEMQTSVENGMNIVCATSERVPGCRIIFTVPPGQDAIATRDRVFENLTIADSGDDTLPVNTFTASGQDPLARWVNLGRSLLTGNPQRRLTPQRQALSLKPFLDPADGGTGSALGKGKLQPANPLLSPDRFR